jgi:hypothetical protein
MPSERDLASGSRVELQLHAAATTHQYRELGMFVRDCLERIEREAGSAEWWTVKIMPNRVCYTCDVIARHRDGVVYACGTGFDGAVAGRAAFRKIEDMLRERAREVACG